MKLSPDDIEAEAEVSFNILEEDGERPDFVDDAADVGPEVALVVLSEPAAGGAEGLAGITGSEDMNAATPRAAVEGSNIRPHRSRIHEPRFHRSNQVEAGEGFDLHMTDDASAGNGQSKAEVKPAASRAEGDDADVVAFGTWSHIHATLLAKRGRPLVERGSAGSGAGMFCGVS